MAKRKAHRKKKADLREVPFQMRDESAREVVLTGDFTQWSREGIRLERGPQSDWRTTLKLAPGEYQYRLIVDGEWRDHPTATRRIRNCFGTENCVLQVR